jgi:hypothetical protein
MNTTVLSFYTPAMQAVGEVTAQHNQKFAERCGFAFQCRILLDETTPDEAMWRKPELIFDLLRAGENVWWIDADAVVTNPEALPPCDPAKITISCDIHGMNAGVFHVPSTPQTLRFFYACLTHGRTLFGDRATGEQRAMQHFSGYEPYKDILSFVPQRVLNSYWPMEYSYPGEDEGAWQPGDFILHMPGLSNERRVDILESLPI